MRTSRSQNILNMGTPSSITCSNKLPLEGNVMQPFFFLMPVSEIMEGVEVVTLGLRWLVKFLQCSLCVGCTYV
jgi:hypothetical protein